MPEKSICIIDPFENVLDVYRMILEEKGFTVCTFAELDQALQSCSSKSYSIIITEFFFPLEKMCLFLRSVKKLAPETYLIVSTSVIIDDPSYKDLFDVGLDDLLVKPYGQEKLMAHIEKGVKNKEIFLENKNNEKGFIPYPAVQEDPAGVFDSAFFKKLIRKEIKKARRHQQPVSLILLKIPSKDSMGARFGSFYVELVDLLRKSLREEDLMGRENGNLAIILDKTDEAGSRNLGRRLTKLIQTHPSFHSDLSLQEILNGLVFQTYTFPHQNNIPEFLVPLLKEIEGEFQSN